MTTRSPGSPSSSPTAPSRRCGLFHPCLHAPSTSSCGRHGDASRAAHGSPTQLCSTCGLSRR
eukprot:scaffold13830_cov73-Phaeocystis_antarctica.AAC.5